MEASRKPEIGERSAAARLRAWLAPLWVPVAAATAVGLWVAWRLAVDNLLSWQAGSWPLVGISIAVYAVVLVGWCAAVSPLLRLMEAGICRRFGRLRASPWTVVAASLAPLISDGTMARFLAPRLASPAVAVAIRVAAAVVVLAAAAVVLRWVDGRVGALITAARGWSGIAALLVIGLVLYGLSGWWVRRLVDAERGVFETAVTAQRPNDRRILLIGVDGASWQYLRAMASDGELPELGALISSGAAGPLRTMEPTLSALIWPTITSGVDPSRHRVRDFFSYRIPGVSRPLIAALRPGLGLPPLLEAGVGIGAVRRLPATSHNCHAPRLWEILGAADSPAAAVGWWATWPTAGSRTIVVADLFFELAAAGDRRQLRAAVAPQELGGRLATLVIRPADVTDRQIRAVWPASEEDIRAMRVGEAELSLHRHFLEAYARDLSFAAVAENLLELEPELQLMAVYLRGLDTVSHLALPYGTPLERGGEQRGLGGLVRGYYRFVDTVVGRLRQAAGPEAVVVVVSDHGFEEKSPGVFDHGGAPEGILIAAGGPIAAGAEVEEADIYDVFPTIAHLLGLEVPADAKGRVLTELIAADWVHDHPIRTVAGYGLRPAAGGDEALSETWDARAAEEKLRALGYLGHD